MDKNTQQELLRIVEKNYNDIADDFHETRKKYLWPELLNLTNEVKNGDSILDVGCGNGRLLEAFKEKKIKYIGIDQSEELIKIAEKYYKSDPRFSVSDFQFRVANILELGKIPQMNFDHVFSIAVLHHLPGEKLRVDALKQLKNKIKNDGKIILTAWNLWPQKKYRKLILKFFILKLIGKNKMDFGDIVFNWKGEEGKKRYYHAFREKELKKLIKKAELKIEKSYKDRYNYYLVLKK